MSRQIESPISKILKLADEMTLDQIYAAVDILRHRYIQVSKRAGRPVAGSEEASASRSESPKGRGRRRATSPEVQTDPAVVGE